MAKTQLQREELSEEPILKYQTWAFKVFIHCQGCMKKVKKVLHSIEGVYTTTIDSQQHKVTVIGNVDADIVIKKLLKSGKCAELWPQTPHKNPGKSNVNNKKQKPCKDGTSNEDNKTEVETTKRPAGVTENAKQSLEEADPDGDQSPVGGETEENAAPAGGGVKKKKKKKGQNGNIASKAGGGGADNVNAPAGTGAPLVVADVAPLQVWPVNVGLPPQQVYQYPATVPAYGLNYNTAPYPSTNSSYYGAPVYGCDNYFHIGSYAPPPYDEMNTYYGCSIM